MVLACLLFDVEVFYCFAFFVGLFVGGGQGGVVDFFFLFS